MEKIKNFVVKYQLWFKIGISILIFIGFFIPFFSEQNIPTPQLKPHLSYLYELPNREYNLNLSPLSIPILIFLSLSIAFIFISIILRPPYFLLLSCLVYCIAFIFLFANFFQWLCFSEQYDISIIPHIAFFLYLLIFLFDIVVSIYLIKHFRKIYPKKPTKSDRIAVLEKKVAELEKLNDIHPEKDNESKQ